METPDKIYLEKERETNKISHLWGVSPVLHSGYEHIEYIRKDTLEEILRKIKYQMNEGCSDCFDFIDWLRDFIDEQLEEC